MLASVSLRKHFSARALGVLQNAPRRSARIGVMDGQAPRGNSPMRGTRGFWGLPGTSEFERVARMAGAKATKIPADNDRPLRQNIFRAVTLKASLTKSGVSRRK
jgi:hypothetical protein